MRMLMWLGMAFVMAAPAVAAPPPRPKLVVAIAVDQFSGNLFEQYRGTFRHGLKTLQAGVVFPSGYQSHAATETCPGHSTILTGRHPAATGIVGNIWYDRRAGKPVYCVEDAAHPVPGRTFTRGPAHLRVTALGDWIKAADPAARVFAVAGKDRAAITMAGQRPDGVFWWDEERGFSTSVPAGTTEAARLAPVAAFNKTLIRGWTRKAPRWRPLDRRCVAGGDDTFGKLTITHSIPPQGYAGAWDTKPNLDYLHATPMLDQATLDLATRLIETQQLGRKPAPDLLAISLSATDYVGHRYGSGGVEMCDQLAHLDRMLGRFLARLSALRVPVVVVLTADHGGLDAVERVAARGIPALRSEPLSITELGRAVQAELGLAGSPLAGDAQQISIVDAGADPARDALVEAAVRRGLAQRSDVTAVMTRAEVAAAVPPPGKAIDELTLAERFHESFDPERSGDIMVAYRPCATGGYPSVPAAFGNYVAGHGSPWNYDRRVPMLFWWPGATGFEQALPVETVDIAPTLAALLGVPVPRVDGRCLDLDASQHGDSCRTATR